MSGVPLVPLVFAVPFRLVPFFRPFFAAPLPLLRRFAECPLTALVLTRAKVKSSQAWNISGSRPLLGRFKIRGEQRAFAVPKPGGG